MTDSVYRSEDGGESWEAYSLGVEGGERMNIAVDIDSTNIVYASTDIGFIKSTDSGQSWDLSVVSSDPVTIRKIKCSPSEPEKVYVTSDGGVMYKTSGGLGKRNQSTAVQWEKLPENLSNSYLRDIEIDPDNSNHLYIMSSGSGIGQMLKRSTDGGYNWTSIPGTQMQTAYDVTLGSIYIGGSWDDDDVDSTSTFMGLFRSTDGGATWDKYAFHKEHYRNFGHVKSVAPDLDDPTVCYAAGNYIDEYQAWIASVMKTTDRGDTWNEIGLSIPRKTTVIRIDPFDHNRIYVGTEKDEYSNVGGLYISTDAGATWQEPAQHFFVKDLVVNNSEEGSLFAGTPNTVYKSSDGGVTWEEIADGLNMGVTCMDFDPVNHVLYAGTEDDGVFRISTGTGVATATQKMPETAVLHQNFPNPFNGGTTIHYSLERSFNVQIAIYDVRGRLVKRLFNGERESGMHRIEWDGRDTSEKTVPSGLYFARMKAGDRVQMKKMILQK